MWKRTDDDRTPQIIYIMPRGVSTSRIDSRSLVSGGQSCHRSHLETRDLMVKAMLTYSPPADLARYHWYHMTMRFRWCANRWLVQRWLQRDEGLEWPTDERPDLNIWTRSTRGVLTNVYEYRQLCYMGQLPASVGDGLCGEHWAFPVMPVARTCRSLFRSV